MGSIRPTVYVYCNPRAISIQGVALEHCDTPDPSQETLQPTGDQQRQEENMTKREVVSKGLMRPQFIFHCGLISYKGVALQRKVYALFKAKRTRGAARL